MTMELSGRCLCGAVTFSAVIRENAVGACHCGMCRKWSAGPFLGVGCSGDAIAVKGEQSLGIYPSSEWGERCFCRTCGSVLFWRTRDRQHWEISAGALDSAAGLELRRQIYIDEKPEFYDFANNTEMLTGAEFVALIQGGGEKS